MTDPAPPVPPGPDRSLSPAIPARKDMARAEAGSATKNELRLPKLLRLQLLDCRSGQPVAGKLVEEIRIDGQVLVRLATPLAWDLVRQYIIATNADGLPRRGLFTPKDPSGLVRQLQALGYPAKGTRYMAPLKSFKTDWNDHLWQLHGESGPDEKTTSIQAWQARIMKEYNRRFNFAAQVQLTALGYDCLADDGKWEQASIQAYQDWQSAELQRTRPVNDVTREDAARLQQARKRFATDAGGVLRIPIKADKVKQGFTVRVSFPEFPLVREAGPLERRTPDPGPTDFTIEWEQGGDAAGGAWHVRPKGSAEARATLPRFADALECRVPACPDRDWKALSGKQPGAFSRHFGPGKDAPELVAFTLVWCQPVWDGIADPAPDRRWNEAALLQRDGERGFNLHVVTTYHDLGGSDTYGGKGYGLYEHEYEPRFRGKAPLTERGGLGRLRALGYPVGNEDPNASEPLLTLNELHALYRRELAAAQCASGGFEIGRRCMQPIWDFQAAHTLQKTGIIDGATLARLEQKLPGRRQEWGDDRDGHQGFDLHVLAGNQEIGGSRAGSPVFALHGGVVARTLRWTGSAKAAAGNYILLAWAGQKEKANAAGYLHMDKLLVERGAPVRAGQVVGLGGRTGNFGGKQPAGSDHVTVSQWPSHVHLNVGLQNALYESPDSCNRCCLPHAGSPLLLPCACEVPAAAHDSTQCRFGQTRFAAVCWAVAELRCPHMTDPVTADQFESGQDDDATCKARRRVQAQLRHLRERHGDPYADPGPLNGKYPPLPTPATKKIAPTRQAIHAFWEALAQVKEAVGVTIPVGGQRYRVNADFLAWLDTLAPVGGHAFEKTGE